jgi:hypothetical protein
VVLRVEDRTLVAEALTKLLFHVQLLLHPQRARHHERAEPLRHHAQIRLEDALELEQRLVVEADVVQILRLDARRLQAVLHRARREIRISLLPGEPLLRAGSDDLAVLHQGGGAVVVVSGDPENVPAAHG